MHDNYPYIAKQRKTVSGAYGDVTGDKVKDYVFLTAEASLDPSSYYVKDIRLNIKDGNSAEIHAIPLPESGNAGYEPTVILADITGGGIKEIIIRIDSGGSGALTYDYIYSYAHHKLKKIFDFEQYNQENQYRVMYLDQYFVSVESLATEQVFLLTIIDRSPDYLEQIYDENGRLKQPIQGMVDGVSGFYPIDMIGNGVYNIQTYQRVSGLYHADALGYIINTLGWDGEKLVIEQEWLALFGESAEI